MLPPAILILGAGRSAIYTIDYLAQFSQDAGLSFTVADSSLALAAQAIAKWPKANASGINIDDTSALIQLVAKATHVVSMLPATLHIKVASICLELKKHLFTASYVSEAMRQLHPEAKAKGLLFLNECGLDPGLDHMSTMAAIADITTEGGTITSFRSYCGGLVAPESNTNPWGYKFSWNPRNVILAGQGHSQYRANGLTKYTPYHRLFSQTTPVNIDGIGSFDGYANRDSLPYIDVYQLHAATTFLRGTLRAKNYCNAWAVLVQLGITDDTYQITLPPNATLKDFLACYLNTDGLVADNIQVSNQFESLIKIATTADATSMALLLWLDFSTPLPLTIGTPAQILQALLEVKWQLQPTDKDMIAMQHLFNYTAEGKNYLYTSSLARIGEDATYTAMAATVGLPLAIAIKLFITGHVIDAGVVIPVAQKWYQPILSSLDTEHGIKFHHMVTAL